MTSYRPFQKKWLDLKNQDHPVSCRIGRGAGYSHCQLCLCHIAVLINAPWLPVYILNGGFVVTATLVMCFPLPSLKIVRRRPQLGVQLRRYDLCRKKEIPIEGLFSFQDKIYRSPNLMGQNGKRLSLAVSSGQFLHIGLCFGIASQKQDCCFRKCPL